jgi:hypothetical protein
MSPRRKGETPSGVSPPRLQCCRSVRRSEAIPLPDRFSGGRRAASGSQGWQIEAMQKARTERSRGKPAACSLGYRSHRNGTRHPASRGCADISSWPPKVPQPPSWLSWARLPFPWPAMAEEGQSRRLDRPPIISGLPRLGHFRSPSACLKPLPELCTAANRTLILPPRRSAKPRRCGERGEAPKPTTKSDRASLDSFDNWDKVRCLRRKK